MGMPRLAPFVTTARRLNRLPQLSGFGGSQRYLEAGSCKRISSQFQGDISPLRDYLGLGFLKSGNCSRIGGSSPWIVNQIEPSGVYNRSFFQSSVQLAKRSPKGTSESSNASKKKTSLGNVHIKNQKRPIVFECYECTAMCVKRISKDAYDRGIVIVRCMACGTTNLISDQLGLLQEPGSMHKFLSDRGVDVRNGLEPSFELTPENLAEPDRLVHEETIPSVL